MLSTRTPSRHGRQIYILKKFHTLVIAFLVILALGTVLFFTLRVRTGTINERRDILRVWNDENYEQAYNMSKNALVKKPVDNFLLTINGFSAFQLGISQINTQNTLAFINECIFSLRKALIHKESSKDARIFYVLGKAYIHKGDEYSDLVIKYLEMANNLSYDAQDISEYLGLAYAASGDYRSSVAAFSQAIVPGRPPSDNLLLSIARSYIAMEEYNLAAGYLKRCIEISPDSKSVVTARLLLAEIHMVSGELENAEELYLTILNEAGENAEVHFQLGELYNIRGDTTRARAEWRIAYRQDPAHARARARLNI